MDLRQALRTSEFRKARITHDNVTTTVEQMSNGYDVRYAGKEKHFVTFDGLAIWLGDEVVNAQWIPVQESEQ